MLLQTNSYLVPKDKRSEHARLLRRFRQTLARLGCDLFEVYEQVGTNWALNQTSGRYVQIMRFRDRRHQQAVQQAEQADPIARQQIAEFCELVNIPYQQQQGLFAVSYYAALLPMATAPGEQSPPDERPASEKRSNGHPPFPSAESAVGEAASSEDPPSIPAAESQESRLGSLDIPGEDLPPMNADGAET